MKCRRRPRDSRITVVDVAHVAEATRDEPVTSSTHPHRLRVLSVIAGYGAQMVNVLGQTALLRGAEGMALVNLAGLPRLLRRAGDGSTDRLPAR